MDQDSASYISKKQKTNCELLSANHGEYYCKFYNKFPFKAMVVVIFLVALPLFPLEAPEFISKTLNTGNWELLVQLVLVGIAVSYGLFSRKTDDDEDETENECLYSSKFDNVQSRLHEVSSFFNDETENYEVSDENKVETWNNYQYYSGKPVVVVAKESFVDVEKHRSTVVSSRIIETPLLLPIRSLKSPVLEPISTTNSPKSMISSPRKEVDYKIVRKQSFNKSSISHPPVPPPLPSSPIVKKSTLLRSSSILTDDKGCSDIKLRRSTKSVPFELSSYKGKSVRTIRPFVGAARARVYAKDFINNGKVEERNKEVEETLVDTKQIQALEKKTSSVERIVMECDEDSDDYVEDSSENVEVETKKEIDMSTEGGQDNVDKKADEFIAKFREQIRLQRIQSIRTSAGQPAKKLLQ